MSDLILDFAMQRAAGHRSFSFAIANQMPDLVVFECELASFSDFEMSIIAVEYDESGEILAEHGGFKTRHEAWLEGFEHVYFHVAGRSKRDIDADSPWYPLHDSKTEKEALRMLARYEALSTSKVA